MRVAQEVPMKAFWQFLKGNPVTTGFMLAMLVLVCVGSWRHPGSWRSPVSAQRAIETEELTFRQQYAGRLLPFEELPSGEYRVIHSEEHTLVTGVIKFSMIRQLANQEILFVADVPDEYCQNGTTFRKGGESM